MKRGENSVNDILNYWCKILQYEKPCALYYSLIVMKQQS
jgi:hypothetical protein